MGYQYADYANYIVAKFIPPSFTYQQKKKFLITHKCRGSQQFLISKSVEPNEELKVEYIFPQVLSTTDTTQRTLDVRFT